MEKAAVSILTRAVQFDEAKRYTEALVCYQEGLQLLVDSLKEKDLLSKSGTYDESHEMKLSFSGIRWWCSLSTCCMRKSIGNVIPPGEKKDAMKGKVESYIKRAELIKKIVHEKKEAGNYHEELQILDNAKGYSYETVMGRFMDCDVEKIDIEDPYIRNFNQICNLLHFCELAVKKCQNLKAINLKTCYDIKNVNEQKNILQSLSVDLLDNHKIQFNVEYSKTLHDRKIIFSNGWIIKIGRGLDYFKPPMSKIGLGKFDLNFRPCRETKIDIYHQKTTLYNV